MHERFCTGLHTRALARGEGAHPLPLTSTMEKRDEACRHISGRRVSEIHVLVRARSTALRTLIDCCDGALVDIEYNSCGVNHAGACWPFCSPAAQWAQHNKRRAIGYNLSVLVLRYSMVAPGAARIAVLSVLLLFLLLLWLWLLLTSLFLTIAPRPRSIVNMAWEHRHEARREEHHAVGIFRYSQYLTLTPLSNTRRSISSSALSTRRPRGISSVRPSWRSVSIFRP